MKFLIIIMVITHIDIENWKSQKTCLLIIFKIITRKLITRLIKEPSTTHVYPKTTVKAFRSHTYSTKVKRNSLILSNKETFCRKRQRMKIKDTSKMNSNFHKTPNLVTHPFLLSNRIPKIMNKVKYVRYVLIKVPMQS